MKKAMSMIELIFVIVIIGILAGVAIPKILVGRSDAYILKTQETVAQIRSGIQRYKQEAIYSDGKASHPTSLCKNGNCASASEYFDAVIRVPAKKGEKAGSWKALADNVFISYIDSSKNGFVFKYEDGKFLCLDSYSGAKAQACSKIGM